VNEKKILAHLRLHIGYLFLSRTSGPPLGRGIQGWWMSQRLEAPL